jgi:hypothetical protein
MLNRTGKCRNFAENEMANFGSQKKDKEFCVWDGDKEREKMKHLFESKT